MTSPNPWLKTDNLENYILEIFPTLNQKIFYWWKYIFGYLSIFIRQKLLHSLVVLSDLNKESTARAPASLVQVLGTTSFQTHPVWLKLSSPQRAPCLCFVNPDKLSKLSRWKVARWWNGNSLLVNYSVTGLSDYLLNLVNNDKLIC